MARIIKADFSNVKDKGGSVRIPEGVYGLKVKSADLEKSKDKTSKNIVFQVITISGPRVGSTLIIWKSLKEAALWSLRGFLKDLGLKVPKKVVSIDLDNMVGKKFGAYIEDEPFEDKDGREKVASKIQETFPYTELAERSKATAPKKAVAAVSGKKKVKAEVEEEEEEEEDEEEEDEEEEEEDESLPF